MREVVVFIGEQWYEEQPLLSRIVGVGGLVNIPNLGYPEEEVRSVLL
jgi:hypothetical protein